jgi:hypothetical protein
MAETVDSDLGLCARCREPRDAAVHAYGCGLGTVVCGHSHHAFQSDPAQVAQAALAKEGGEGECY